MKDQAQTYLDQLYKSMEKPTPEALYYQLGRLRTDMPPWKELGSPTHSQWVGRVLAVVEATENSLMELVSLRTNFDWVNRNAPTVLTAKLIGQSIDTVLAKLELKLPAQAQGAFIPAGGVFDGYQVISKAMSAAQKHVFIIDPYADDTLISDFVPLAPEGLAVYVLSDAQTSKPSLKPAMERWTAQWQAKRPLEVRLAPARTLHDRLLVTDNTTAWVVGQSFKDLAKRAHSSLVRMDNESGELKIGAHTSMWHAATKLA